MKRIKNVLTILAYTIFLFALALPAAMVYFVLSIVVALFDFMSDGTDQVRDALDDCMTTLCKTFEDWIP